MNRLTAGLRLGVADDLAAAVLAAAVLAAAATVLAAAAVLAAATLFAAAATTVEGARSEAFFEAFDTEFHDVALSRKRENGLGKYSEVLKKAHTMPISRAA